LDDCRTSRYHYTFWLEYTEIIEFKMQLSVQKTQLQSTRPTPPPCSFAPRHTLLQKYFPCPSTPVSWHQPSTRILSTAAAPVQPEAEVTGMTQYLDKLKYNQDGLVAVIVQVRSNMSSGSRISARVLQATEICAFFHMCSQCSLYPACAVAAHRHRWNTYASVRG